MSLVFFLFHLLIFIVEFALQVQNVMKANQIGAHIERRYVALAITKSEFGCVLFVDTMYDLVYLRREIK